MAWQSWITFFFVHPVHYQLSISEFNVRLSQSPNKGFIEVKDGSTWRKVNEERWDENRQKMLCQHLKFNETDENNIITKNIGSGSEIATGDLHDCVMGHNQVEHPVVSISSHLYPLQVLPFHMSRVVC